MVAITGEDTMVVITEGVTMVATTEEGMIKVVIEMVEVLKEVEDSIIIEISGGMTEGIMITELVLVHANFLFKKDFVAKEIPADSDMSNRPEENRNQKKKLVESISI